MYESRRPNGKRRGGIAIYVRKNLSGSRVKGQDNEFAQQVTVQLPDGTKLVVTNVYLPPTKNLKKRGILEEEARAQVEDIMLH